MPTQSEVLDLIAKLERLAPDVTPGPWRVYDGCSWRRIGTEATRERPRYDDCAVIAPTKASDGHPDLTCSAGNDREANLEWIALCSPDNVLSILAALAALPQAEPGWRDMRDAPTGEVTEDVGCRGNSEWFLARPAKRYRDLGAAPMVVIRRRPWPQDDSWADNGDTHYVPHYFDGWMPLPTAPTPAIEEGRSDV